MKKLTQSEQGYTLLFTVAVIVIFTILGLGLITLTSSGIKKNEVRQNTVQARDLADKGIKYAVNDIQLYLEKQIKNNPMGKTQFYDLLSDTLTKNCPDRIDGKYGIVIPGENSSETKVCIDKVEMLLDEKDRYKRRVTFKSTGIVNGKTHTTTSIVIIGTDAIPDQLRYALSTNDSGDMYLHGGVEVQGDIKTDGNLIIAKKAHWMSGSTAVWEDSVGARLIKDTKSVSPKIIMRENGKNIYIVKNQYSNSINYNKHIENTTENKINYLDTSRYTKINPIDANAAASVTDSLLNTPNLSIVTKSLPSDTIDVKAKIDDNFKSTKYSYDGLNIKSQSNLSLLSNKNDTIFVGKKYDVCIRTERQKVRGTWTDVCVEYKEAYQNRDMNINTSNNNFSLRGTYYVSGDLNISNTKLSSDALIYVNGSVTITESTLNGLGDNGTLIIFANGDINISNISKYSDTASKIKGFFYTKANVLMYGVFSNMNIDGGVSSKRLILSALRGHVGYTNMDSVVGESESSQRTKNSRLKITYDENLISTYTNFLRDQEEEYITELNSPEFIERTN